MATKQSLSDVKTDCFASLAMAGNGFLFLAIAKLS
jgi:hypothetical protein